MSDLKTTCLLFAAMLASVPEAAAHPIAKQNHDRTIQVRLTDSEVLVEYVLALDEWTLVRDLVPFSDSVEYTGQVRQLYEAFARIYGPIIAKGLAARVDGREITFTYFLHQCKVEDHLRFTFFMRAAYPATSKQHHRFEITDSNFTLEPGIFRLGVREEGKVSIQGSNVPSDPELAKPVNMEDYYTATNDEHRSASVIFKAAFAGTTGAEAPPPAAVEDAAAKPGFWEVAQSGSIRKLLDSNAGLVLLLALAFAFGAAHALQPGHGKTLVAAYLVGEHGTIAHAFILGLVTTLTHTSVVILLAIVVPLVYRGAEAEIHFGLAFGCGVLVVLMAFWLLLRRLAGQADHVHLFGGHHHHGHGGHDHHHHHHSPPTGRMAWWGIVSLGITGGLVPCVDALALLTATWVTKQMWLGLPLILAFSLGLASILVAIGVLTVKFKRFASSRWGEGRFVRSLPIVSAMLTLGLGLWMCHDALQQKGILQSSPAAVSSEPRP